MRAQRNRLSLVLSATLIAGIVAVLLLGRGTVSSQGGTAPPLSVLTVRPIKVIDLHPLVGDMAEGNESYHYLDFKVTSSGLYVLTVHGPASSRTSEVVKMSPSGDLVRRLSFPSKLSEIAVSEKGQIAALSDDEQTGYQNLTIYDEAGRISFERILPNEYKQIAFGGETLYAAAPSRLITAAKEGSLSTPIMPQLTMPFHLLAAPNGQLVAIESVEVRLHTILPMSNPTVVTALVAPELQDVRRPVPTARERLSAIYTATYDGQGNYYLGVTGINLMEGAAAIELNSFGQLETRLRFELPKSSRNPKGRMFPSRVGADSQKIYWISLLEGLIAVYPRPSS